MSESFLDGVAPARPPYKSLTEAYAADPRPEIAEAIAASAGLYLSAITETQTISPGNVLPVQLAALQRVPAGVELLGVQLGSVNVPGPGALSAPWIQKTQYTPDAVTSDPAWLQQPPEDGYYPIENFEDRIRPEPPPPLFADFLLRTGTQNFTVRRPVVVKWVDPVLGERTKAVEIAPPATVDAAPLLLFPDAGARPLRATVRASAGPVEGVLRISGGEGFSIEPAERPFKLEAGELGLEFTVKPGARAREATLALELIIGGKAHDRGLRRLEYAHIPPQSWHPLSRVKAVRLDLKRGSSKAIGYVDGAGDEVAAVLAELGYQVTPLDEHALLEKDLSAYDAIVLGVRAFNVRPWLASLKPKLFDYVERGGVLVEQYNTKNWISKLPEPLGPWPMRISQQRVTDETAEVTLGADPVLRGPNRIGPSDFEGWVQERGLYFADQWDDKYVTPLSMHDPLESPLKGGLLIARCGKGRFVYTGLAFFRQLPAGVPGAIRLFVNLLARDKDAS